MERAAKRVPGISMMKERGMVDTVSGDKALVLIPQSSSCATCESRSACRIENDREIRVEVKNDLHAKAGDQVEISMPAPSLFKMGMLVYLFPVLAMVLGAWIGHVGAGHLQMDENLFSIVMGISALVISFSVLKKIDRSLRSRPEYTPRMTRIINGVQPGRAGGSR